MTVPRETYEELELSRARLAREAHHQRRRADYLYTRLRLLENKVRDAITRGGMPDEMKLDELAWLARIPSKPRPTLSELRKEGRR